MINVVKYSENCLMAHEFQAQTLTGLPQGEENQEV